MKKLKNKQPGIARIILSSFRPSRSLHYMGMTATGCLVAAIGTNPPTISHMTDIFLKPDVILTGLYAMGAIFFAFQALNIFNHIWDLRLGMDKEEFTRTFSMITLVQWRGLAWLYCGMSVFLLMPWKNLAAFFFLSFYYLVGGLYIVPPLRWKRWFPLSTFLLAIAALIAMTIGFVSFPDSTGIDHYPKRLALIIMVTLTFSFGTKDRKDFDRDQKVGIKTLYTTFGNYRGRYVNALLVFLSYSSVPLLLGHSRYIPLAVLFGVLSGLVTSSKKYYREGIIFFLYCLFAVLLLGSILMSQPILLY